jgi:hypothetical protein
MLVAGVSTVRSSRTKEQPGCDLPVAEVVGDELGDFQSLRVSTVRGSVLTAGAGLRRGRWFSAANATPSPIVIARPSAEKSSNALSPIASVMTETDRSCCSRNTSPTPRELIAEPLGGSQQARGSLVMVKFRCHPGKGFQREVQTRSISWSAGF